MDATVITANSLNAINPSYNNTHTQQHTYKHKYTVAWDSSTDPQKLFLTVCVCVVYV